MDTTIDKYNAALETAKKWIADGCSEKERICLESVFPELRENKDEIHRKWILEYLHDGLSKADEQFKGQFKAAIVWLEKKEESNIDKLRKISTPAEENWPEIQKQWEQEDSADEDEKVREELIQYLRDYPHLPNGKYSRLDFFAWIERQKEQKPAGWTDADEKILKRIIDRQTFIIPVPEKGPVSVMFERREDTEAINWLKRRVTSRPQQEQEWSEEDEKMRESAISFVQAVNSCRYILGVDKHDVSNWLKSRRPQPQWKPSEEQMAALYTAAREAPIIKENGNYLYDLYEQLKKL